MRGRLIIYKIFLCLYFYIIFPCRIIIQRVFLGLRWDFLKIFPPMQNIYLFVLSSSFNPTSCSRIQYTKLLKVEYSVCSSYFHWFLNIYFIYFFSSTILVFFYNRILLIFPFISNMEEKLQLSVSLFNCR